jgi:hypothetical protein
MDYTQLWIFLREESTYRKRTTNVGSQRGVEILAIMKRPVPHTHEPSQLRIRRISSQASGKKGNAEIPHAMGALEYRHLCEGIPFLVPQFVQIRWGVIEDRNIPLAHQEVLYDVSKILVAKRFLRHPCYT